MRAPAEVAVHDDREALVDAVAARLLARVAEVQAGRPRASVVLTGGGTGIAVLAAVAASPSRGTVDWSRLDLWWGDERFLPSGHPDRNETQARAALLDHVPLDRAHVHPVPGPDERAGGEPEAAAEAYAALLAEHAQDAEHGAEGAAVPRFDVLLLGMGGEGHVGSIFPDSPAVRDARTVAAVRDCPKPPALRVTLTLPAIRAARESWLVVSGEDKADAVALALGGADQEAVPAAGVSGGDRTLWLLDRAAASGLPVEPGGPSAP